MKKPYSKASIYLIIIFVIIILCITILSFTFSIKRVNGNSMYPSIKDNQVVLINNSVSKLYRGDIIVFYYDGMMLVKRIIAINGDIVEVANGKLCVNGEELFETNENISEKIYIKENKYFTVGDNYDESYDSRDFGTVDLADIVGVVVLY